MVESLTSPTGGSTKPQQDRIPRVQQDDNSSSGVAHTLTACSRCRQRKTRCDPGLPRCGPCERTNAVCEYWDPAKRRNINRDYVVWLQHRVRELELEADKIESDDTAEDPELMMRSAASVKLQDADETKFLGPSSGTQLTRLVMLLAKQFTDAKTIKDVVPDAKARHVKELYAAEADKPTSKIYPLTSDVAAEDLPNRDLTALLVQLYNSKVQPMYPALHEPTLAKDVEDVYAGHGNAYQHYILRMVIAISLQKMDTQYAGLADSYYLAALKYMEAVVKPMDLGTLQCFALIAEYSLLTPTRTAIYYVVGLAVRLCQALGIHEEKTIVRGKGGTTLTALEIDMRRRMFWCIFVMECGLCHALGRPVSLATGREHLDVGFFETCPDEYITDEGILPGAPNPTLKKWIAVHFFKMRLLQLEIRRTLYQRKRPTPKDEQDPWFTQMTAKMDAWRDASPNNDEGIGLDKVWFIGRYNTMIAFLHRPCPQIPRPSLAAALKCFDAARFNIYMTREQINRKNVDLTWVFTQAIFLAINTMLWSLSYEEVRRQNPRSEVEMHLNVGMEAIDLASHRWPGVASAHGLYLNIINAILKVYDKDGNIPIAPSTPSDAASPVATFSSDNSRSRTESPAAFSANSIPTPTDPTPPFGYFNYPSRRGEAPPSSASYAGTNQTPPLSSPAPTTTSSVPYSFPSSDPQTSPSVSSMQYSANMSTPLGHPDSSPNEIPVQFQPLPTDFPTFAMNGWGMAHTPTSTAGRFGAYATPHIPGVPAYPNHENYNRNYQDPLQQQADTYLNPGYWNQSVNEMQGSGLNAEQQMELMQSLETTGVGDIEMMIEASNRLFNPPSRNG